MLYYKLINDVQILTRLACCVGFRRYSDNYRGKSSTFNLGGLMGILSWIVLGLIAGALAKWIMPGRDGGGIIVTIVLGVAGAFVGGWLGSLIGLGRAGNLSIGSIITATAGAVLLLFVYRKLQKR
jgi:uncharacterized membrane protein YeaQ/YmgE (transglycosylase-associated protein family)